jgi:RimJ/RimL family protein N-acetyltransferase
VTRTAPPLTIEAGPFTLRPWVGADAAFVFDACQDADIQRWTTVPTPYRAGDAAAFVRRHARPQPEASGAWFALTRTESGELLGSMSFNRFDRSQRNGEIGYWLVPDGRGQGAASTCVDALSRWGFAALGLDEVRLLIARGNLASQRVAARAGFTPNGLLPGGCRDGDVPDDGLVFVRRASSTPL